MANLKAGLKTNLVYGLAVLIPLGILALLVFKMVEIILAGAGLLGLGSFFAIVLACILALAGLLALCLAIGLAIRTRLGELTFSRFERTVLYQVPGYEIIKNVLVGFAEEKAGFPAVAVQLHGPGVEELAFLIEDGGEGRMTVFVPLAPTLTVGKVYVVDAGRVRLLSADSMKLVNCISRWGIGSLRAAAQKQKNLEA